jgi:hypothetical protein
MDKRYQGVIKSHKSKKDRQYNGQKIPRGNKKTNSMKDRQNMRFKNNQPMFYISVLIRYCEKF